MIRGKVHLIRYGYNKVYCGLRFIDPRTCRFHTAFSAKDATCKLCLRAYRQETHVRPR